MPKETDNMASLAELVDLLRGMAHKDVPEISDDYLDVPRSEWVFASVPTETYMGETFPTVRINGYVFEPGFNDLAPPKYAEHVKEIVRGVQAEAVRRLRPNQDVNAILQQMGGSEQQITGKMVPYDPASGKPLIGSRS